MFLAGLSRGLLFYFTSTTWTNIQATRATTIAGLKTATPKMLQWNQTEALTGKLPGARGSSTILPDRAERWTTNASTHSEAPRILYGTAPGRMLTIPKRDDRRQCCRDRDNVRHGGSTWIVFSASSCAGTGYQLGRLTLTGTNPLSASSWTKYANPIFTGANGHTAELVTAGGQIWMVYHASAASPGLCDGSRYMMVQQVGWYTDGAPNLGSPRALTDSVPEPA
ncbi:Arabinanase/levansucrase/invertase [Mycena crocata]|nr:Arabinanase/levansucrase/invertase [Mycena crocata]